MLSKRHTLQTLFLQQFLVFVFTVYPDTTARIRTVIVERLIKGGFYIRQCSDIRTQSRRSSVLGVSIDINISKCRNMKESLQ